MESSVLLPSAELFGEGSPAAAQVGGGAAAEQDVHAFCMSLASTQPSPWKLFNQLLVGLFGLKHSHCLTVWIESMIRT